MNPLKGLHCTAAALFINNVEPSRQRAHFVGRLADAADAVDHHHRVGAATEAFSVTAGGPTGARE
jgi:hypothetical protein